MGHASIYFAHPRRFGPGSRQWYVLFLIVLIFKFQNQFSAVFVSTTTVLFASTASTCAVGASVSTPQSLDFASLIKVLVSLEKVQICLMERQKRRKQDFAAVLLL